MRNWMDADPTADEAAASERADMIMDVVLSTLDHLGDDEARRVYLAHVAFGVPLAVLSAAMDSPQETIRAVLRSADAHAGSLLRDLVGQLGTLSVGMSPGLDRLARRLGVLPMLVCRACGEPMTFRPRGRPRRYCSPRCRQAGHRRAFQPPAEAGLTAEHLRELPEPERVRMVAEVPSDLAAFLLGGLEPADRARVFNRLRPQRALAVSRALPVEHAAEMLPWLQGSGRTIASDIQPQHLIPSLARLTAPQVAQALDKVDPADRSSILAGLPRRLAAEVVRRLLFKARALEGMVPKHASAAAAILLRLPRQQAVLLLAMVKRNIGGALLASMAVPQAANLLEDLMMAPASLPGDESEDPAWIAVGLSGEPEDRAWIAAGLLQWVPSARSEAVMGAMGATAADLVRHPPRRPGGRP